MSEPTNLPADLLRHDSWRARITHLLEANGTPGVQVGVLAIGETPADDDLRVLSAGITNLATGVEVDDHTLFQYGSISKVWTTTLIMQLVDDGLLALDDRVADVLPDFRIQDAHATERITVRHLLTHTSGINGDVFTDTGDGDDCVAAYVASLSDAISVTAPGGPISYSNAGFVVAGRIIELLRGMTWDAAVQQFLCRPLGLRRTVTRAAEAIMHRAAMGHQDTGDDESPVAPAPVWSIPRSVGPAGSITGPVADLLTFAAMHLRGGVAPDGTRVLSEASAQRMRGLAVPLGAASTVDVGWGLGWIVTDWIDSATTQTVRAVQHGGHTYGQLARLTLFPERGVAFAVLTNADRGLGIATRIQQHIGEELGLTMPQPAREPDATAADVAHTFGDYESEQLRYTLGEDEDGVFLRGRSLGDHIGTHDVFLRAEPAGRGRVVVTQGDAVAEFAHVVSGDAEYLYMYRLFRRV
jgi:CubicO group peptidase (beta-lactamase class C family)